MAWFRDNLGVGALGWCLWKVFELVCSCLILQLLCCLRLLHFQTFVGRLTFQFYHSYSLASPFCGNVKRRLPVVVSSIRLEERKVIVFTHTSKLHVTIAMSINADGDCQCWFVCEGDGLHTHNPSTYHHCHVCYCQWWLPMLVIVITNTSKLYVSPLPCPSLPMVITNCWIVCESHYHHTHGPTTYDHHCQFPSNCHLCQCCSPRFNASQPLTVSAFSIVGTDASDL